MKIRCKITIKILKYDTEEEREAQSYTEVYNILPNSVDLCDPLYHSVSYFNTSSKNITFSFSLKLKS
jgi:hypothetical protein